MFRTGLLTVLEHKVRSLSGPQTTNWSRRPSSHTSSAQYSLETPQAFGVLPNTPGSVIKKLEPLDEVMLEPREPAGELERQACEGLRVRV